MRIVATRWGRNTRPRRLKPDGYAIHGALLFALLGLAICRPIANADELPRAKAVAPDNFLELRKGLGGAYYVDAPIKKRYDDLVALVQALQQDVQRARISEADARQRIEKLRREVQAALQEINEKEVFVAPASVHKKRESKTFSLGPEAILLVKADQVQIVGWDKPHVEAILEKVVLSADDQSVAADLNAIQIAHRPMTGAEGLGYASRQQRAEWLAKLTPELLAKQSFMESTYRNYVRLDPEILPTLNPEVAAQLRSQPSSSGQLSLAEHLPFDSFMDKTVDVVELEGLTYQAGNRSLILEITSKNGGGSSSSVWRRHAKLTLYVPQCKMVAVWGAHEGLDIQSVNASVELKSNNVPQRDATYRVKDLHGSLIARDLPLHLVENVTGDVDVIHTADAGITSGPNGDGIRGQVSRKSEKSNVYRQIGGHLVGWFVQANLELAQISGQVDVRNEFGSTVWVLEKPAAQAAHRVVSEAGEIQIQLPQSDADELPIMTLSEVGNVYIPDTMKQLKNVMFSTPGDHDIYHSWQGFMSERDSSNRGMLYFQRVSQILHDEPRSAGLDFISRAGSVRIVTPPPLNP
jgi:hypothetical protein